MADVLVPNRQDLRAHPAFDAWKRLSSGVGEPSAILPLKEYKKRSGKSAVYRMDGSGPRGESIVAKRCKAATAEVERTIYEQILPGIDLPSPLYYGYVADPEPDYWWLFLEFMEGEPFSPDDGDHRRAAARWVSRIHIASSEGETSPLLAKLPDRGPNHYLKLLRGAHAALQESMHDVAFQSVRDVHASLVATLDSLEREWDPIARRCFSLPPSLVHGDLVAKNVRVRAEKANLAIYAFDWETGGMGIPSVDLVNVDHALYWEGIRGDWPWLELSDIEALTALGRLFRIIAAISWACVGLPYGPTAKPVAQLHLYESELREAARVVTRSG